MFPFPAAGDGGDGGGADYTNSYPTYTFDTNQLWLQITNVADGLANLNLHNATNQVYAIWTTTNLLGDWQVQTELWPALDQTNVLPFTLPTAGQPTLFVRAEDWTGVTENGNTVPDWWFWEYFGTMAFSDTNLDAAGNFLADDYNNQVAPVVFLFSGIEVTNNFINSPSVPVHLAVSGSPYYAAVLVDDTNFSNAAWNTYSSPEMTVNLGLTQGWHDVRIGLRGHADDATNAVWQWQRVKLDYTPPQLVITNPAGTLVDKPVIQLQGYCSKALIGITYDLSNAAGTVTGQPVLVEGQDYSTNTWEYTTNYFQAYDVPLTNGVNAITLHATDLAGNTTSTNFSFTVDYSGKTNAPAVNLLWPQAGMEIIGSNIVCRGWVSDDTATVTVQLVDANGNASTVGSLVGRDGNFYAGNLTLAAGTNWLTYTVVDAAGNRATTNITFSTSDLGLTLNTVAAGQSVVTGTIDDSSYTVYVNGVQATNDEFGNWSATIAPIGIGGGAVVVNAIQNGGDPTLQQVVDPPQGVFESQYHQKDRQEFIAVGEPYPYLILGGRIDWGDGMGGIEENLGEELTNGVVSESTGGLMSWPGTHWPEPLPNGNSGTNMGVPPSLSYWQEHCDVQTSIHQAFWTASTERRTADAEMKLATGGPAGSRQQNLWVLSATAADGRTGQPIPPEQISIGSYGHLDTNGNLYVVLPDNDPSDVTPRIAGTNYYKFSKSAWKRVCLQSLTVISNAVQVGGTNNWAAVKAATNDWVYVQATLSTDDTNAANHIQWSGGEGVPGNPFQRRVTKGSSSKTAVTAALGSTNMTVNVWIIWATVTIQTSGSNPSPLSFLATSPPSSNQLGVVFYYTNTYAAGQICGIFAITPAGIHTIITNGWDVFQRRMSHDFDNGSISSVYYDADWKSDGPDDADFNKTVIPDSKDKLYTIDAPNISAFGSDSSETYNNFYDYITWDSQICCETNHFWHWQGRWKANQTPAVTFTDLGGGIMVLPQSPFYSAP